MCGRVTLTLDKQTVLDILGDVFQVSNTPEIGTLPNYNIAPSNNLLSVINTGKAYHGGQLKWGFVPSWAKDESIGYSMINARSETIENKTAFKDSFSSKRCILLADSFYEWKREKTKRPFRFQITDQSLIPFAGIYSSFTREDGSKLYTCSILTCEPNKTMANIHNRMPVILNPSTSKIWLNQETTHHELKDLCVPYSDDKMSLYEVNPYVNSVKNNNIQCIEPADIQQTLFNGDSPRL